MDIINLIRKNNLSFMNIDRMAKSLSKITKEAEVDCRNEINNKIDSGELFVDDKDRIIIIKDSQYLLAKLQVNKKGYGFAHVEGMKDIFIPRNGLNTALDGDTCYIEITNKKTAEDVEGKIVKVLKRNSTRLVGTLMEAGKKFVVFPDNPRLPQVRISKTNVNNAKNNDKVWVQLDVNSIDDNTATGSVIEVLGQTNTPKAEQLAIIRSYNLEEEFDEATMNCAKAVNQNIELKNFKKRTDFTEQNIITIDGEDARDFDDAISVERKDDGFTLYVHIADVSNYVVKNSALDKTAFKRGTSVYFPNMVIPMLPKELSNGICSLNEGVNRLTLSVVVDLDNNCNVKTSKIVEGVIKSKHRMTYTEIQNILDGDKMLIEKYADVYQDILTYQEISNKLKANRRARGEIVLNMPEPFILEDEHGEIISIENRVQNESNNIIESLMILANECVAKKFNDLRVPFVYRVHEKPDEAKVLKLSEVLKTLGISNNLTTTGNDPRSYQQIVDKVKGEPDEKIISMLVLRTMMKARYAPTCLGHFGLASEYYCHFTSPIRRYPDLLIHRIIKDKLHGATKDDLSSYKDYVAKASEQASLTEKNADEAERAIDDYKKAVYMTKHVGEEFEGIISGVQEFGIFIELDNGVEGLVKLENLPEDNYVYDETTMQLKGFKHTFKLGDKATIIVSNVNTQLRQIDFDLKGVEKTFNNFVVKKTGNKNSTISKMLKKKQKKTERGIIKEDENCFGE